MAAEGRSLEETPSWAVAVVCATFIAVSILLEHAIHLLAEFLRKRKKKLLYQSLHRIKSDLMLLGFISLLLTVAQQPVSKICVPKRLGKSFLPCTHGTVPTEVEDEEASCRKKGMISLVSRDGSQQLQLLTFSLAFFHVVSCLLTMGLGFAKMKKWESWEEETKTLDYQFSNDPRRVKLVRETTFGRRHLKFWSDQILLLWPVCFLRQLAGSVSKADYFALRRGFITAHFGGRDCFDFHQFLGRSLDSDFVKVVGNIRLWTWVISMLFIFFQAHEFHSYFWLPFVPLLILFVIGTKLEVIITRLCLESSGVAVVSGALLVKPHNRLFWFGRPQWLLHLIHLVLFQNSFQVAFFTWSWYNFGLQSCFHRRTEDFVIRIAASILVQLLCGYVTLPLYALVTQMGSSMKPEIFGQHAAGVIKDWHMTAKQNATRELSDSENSSTRWPVSFSSGIALPAVPFPLLPAGAAPSEAHGSVSPEPNDMPMDLTRLRENTITEELADPGNAVPKGGSSNEISFNWSQ